MKLARGVVRRRCGLAAFGLALPLVALGGSVAGASQPGALPPGALPPGLQPTQVDITNDPGQRYGEPELAVNPTNPNNIVYYVMSNQSTYPCEATSLVCSTFINGEPLGAWSVPGWFSTKLFVTFDRGTTWQSVNFPTIPAFRGFLGEGTDHSDLISRADPMVTVTGDGTFYIGWDAEQFCVPGTDSCLGAVDGGIAVSKSTDGGRTWSTPVLTGTGLDRPFMTTDLSTGRVYEASSGPVNANVSTGNPSLPTLPPGSLPLDRRVVSSTDGVHWSDPQPLGAPGMSGASGSTISAANGLLAAGFRSTSDTACEFFVGTGAPCVVFETSPDSGATWNRYAVPAPADSTGNVEVAADPAEPGTFSVVVLDSTGTIFLPFVTHDGGSTWSAGNSFTDSPTIKFKAWINYSPQGVLGITWRSAVPTASPGASNLSVASGTGPVTAGAADDPACGLYGCNAGPPDDNDTDPAPVPYTLQAAISGDQGSTWSAPLQISTAVSPASDPLWSAGGDRDDTSVVALSGQDALFGWGDWRPTGLAGDHEVQGFFSAVKLQTFTHP